MTNGEKYKTAQERIKAYNEWCNDSKRKRLMKNAFVWLDLEAEEEKPLPCPFCGGVVDVYKADIGHFVNCHICAYSSGINHMTRDEVVAAHNRVARVVIAAKAKENLNGESRN